MSAARRLIAFAALLALVFGAAAFAGDRAGWTPRTGGEDASGGHGEDDGMTSEHRNAEAAGLAVSEDGLTFALDRTHLQPGGTTQLRFRIVGKDGMPVRDFDVEHTKRMHLIVVRRDLSGFQHLHPTQDRDGSWRVALRVDDPGAYRVFADFTLDGERHTLGADLAVDGPFVARPLPAAASVATVDGYRVTLDAADEGNLRFSVTRGGKAVEVEPYLGARGHLVTLREGDLAFLHVHPDADSLSFMTAFPSAGRYRLFLQFQHEGRVHTAAFTQEVRS